MVYLIVWAKRVVWGASREKRKANASEVAEWGGVERSGTVGTTVGAKERINLKMLRSSNAGRGA
jgi:hypothetical protein